MSEGRVQQIGTPTDIYNEPANSFVADFIGESNILNGVMLQDRLVRFMGRDFECVDAGFGENVPVDVVIRPEDVYIMAKSGSGMFDGVVQSCIFKGVHYEMTVLTSDRYEIMIQDYNAFDVGQEVSLIVKPSDIHVRIGKDIRIGSTVFTLDEHGRTRLPQASTTILQIADIIDERPSSEKTDILLLSQPADGKSESFRPHQLAATISQLCATELVEHHTVPGAPGQGLMYRNPASGWLALCILAPVPVHRCASRSDAVRC
jgi:hypothetical protein